MEQQIQVFSFFSGMGLLDLGFEKSGFDIAFVDEYNERFLEGYKFARRYSNHTPCYGYSTRDIRDYLDDDIWNSTFPDYSEKRGDIGFVGGPPCPDFSMAGTNQGADGENGRLTEIYINLIVKRQPAFFVFENVEGLYQTKKHREYYEKVKTKLYRAGYSLFDSLENSLWYGVPQDRKRLILVGFNRKIFGKNIRYKIGGNRRYSQKEIENVDWPKENVFIVNSDIPCPRGIIRELTVEYWFEKNMVMHHPNSEDYFNIKSKEKFYSIPEGHSQGKSFKRLHRWRYSPTAAYGNNEVHLHPYLPRRLSVAEVLAIQSAPSYISLPVKEPLSLKFKMVGNGVPYLLALGIASELYEWLAEFKKL